MWRIEYIRAPRPDGVDLDELPWLPVVLDPWIDPYNLVAMSREKSEREASADGAYVYRLVRVEPQPVGAEMRWVRVDEPTPDQGSRVMIKEVKAELERQEEEYLARERAEFIRQTAITLRAKAGMGSLLPEEKFWSRARDLWAAKPEDC